MRVLHLITGLETGGAETALHHLLAGMDSRFDNRVVSLIAPGFMGQRLVKLGVSVSHLDMRRGVPSLSALFSLARMIREFSPDLIQTWLYHADLLGLAATRLAAGFSRAVPVAWNLRCSYMDLCAYPRTTAWTVKACALLSGFPVVVVANSRSAAEYHQGLGYKPRRVEIIPNGVDTDHFAPDPEAGPRLRAELGLPRGAMVAGMAARFDPMKDFQTLLSALAEPALAELHLVLCGHGLELDNQELAAWITKNGLERRVHLLGHRADVGDILAGLNIYVSCSRGESFPNVVAEAMGCGVPTVATDVGASSEVVGEAGRVVPVGDVHALAAALAELLAMPEKERVAIGIEGRQRMKHFTPQACVARYESLYDGLCAKK